VVHHGTTPVPAHDATPSGTVPKPAPSIQTTPTPPTAQRDTAPQLDAPGPLRLADGTVLPSGAVIESGRDQPLERHLADGTALTLMADSALEVPAAGEPWRLRRGTVACVFPLDARSGRDGIATTEMVAKAAGQIQLSTTADGSRLRLLAGDAAARDLATAKTVAVRVGEELWIPSDDAAPRDEDGASGSARGTVVEIGVQGRSLVLSTRFGVFTFVPEWVVQSAGPDQAMITRLAALRRGDQIAITWRSFERLRVQTVRMIAAAPADTGPRRDAAKPPDVDF